MSIWKKSTNNLGLGDVPANENNFLNVVAKRSLSQGHIKNMVVLFDMVPSFCMHMLRLQFPR